MIVREVLLSDFQDLVNNYYSSFDEVKTNPELGLGLFHSKPSMADELDWFSGLYKGVINGNNVAMVAELDSKVVGFCEVRCSLQNCKGLA